MMDEYKRLIEERSKLKHTRLLIKKRLEKNFAKLNHTFKVGQNIRVIFDGISYGQPGTIKRIDDKDIIVKTDSGCPTLDWRYIEPIKNES